jgi:hypothetical protein
MGGHTERMGEVENTCTILTDKREEKRSLGKPPSENTTRECGLDSSGSGYGPVASSCEHRDDFTYYLLTPPVFSRVDPTFPGLRVFCTFSCNL